MSSKAKGYDLSKAWWNFAYEHPDVKPVHSALYFYIVDLWNRLGQKDDFNIPTTHTMEALGVSNYKTYSTALQMIHQWGFISFIEKSSNQYTSNKIALVKNTKALYEALPKALYEALPEANDKNEDCFGKNVRSIAQSTTQSIAQSIVSIDKPLTLNLKPNNSVKNKIEVGVNFFEGFPFDVFKNLCGISYQAILPKLKDVPITEADFEKSFNEQYLGISFTNTNHLTNSVRKHLQTLHSHATVQPNFTNGKKRNQSIGTGTVKTFSDGHGLGT
jgi:hypothetical protein